jgi:hypothetical protein
MSKTTKKVSGKPARPRRIKLGTYKSFRLQKSIKHPGSLPNSWQLTRRAAALFWKRKELFAGITIIYGVLNLLLAQGIGNGADVPLLKEAFNQVFTGHFGFVPTGLSIFVVLIGTAGNTTSQTAGAYQGFLAIIESLAIIWSLRQVVAGSVPRVRDAFYRGMTPLIPFMLVLLVIGAQLLPLIIGSSLYSLVISNGIAVYAIEKVMWALLFACFGILSLYMLSSSIFALYIVTLPDMTPIKALRSARGLVRYRRWTVLRKLLFLPLVLLVVAAAVMMPVIILLTPFAQWAFFLLTMFGLVAVHSYVYALYRELLNE